MKREKKSPEFWAALKAEYRAGGVTHKELASKHQVNIHTLKEYIRPNGGGSKKSTKAVPSFVKVHLSGAGITNHDRAVTSKPQVMALVGATPEYLAAFIKSLNGPC
jgi:transposase-like protein